MGNLLELRSGFDQISSESSGAMDTNLTAAWQSMGVLIWAEPCLERLAIIFIIATSLLQDFNIFLLMGSLIAASSRFTFFAGLAHVFVQAGTMYNFDCSVERFLLSHCSDLFDPLKTLCILSGKDL